MVAGFDKEFGSLWRISRQARLTDTTTGRVHNGRRIRSAPLHPSLRPSRLVREGLFGFSAPLSAEQTGRVAARKQVVYDGLKLPLIKGVPREAAGILVDEQFGAAILRDACANGLITGAPAEKSGQEEFQFEYGDRYAAVKTNASSPPIAAASDPSSRPMR
jgi:hypothetical protein